MTTSSLVLAGCLIWLASYSSVAQTTDPISDPVSAQDELTQPVGPPGDGVYAITEAGQHHRRWERLSTVTSEDGTLLTQTNSFVEIASGLNRLDSQTGRFVPAEARFELINGAAISRHTGHSVIITGLTDEVPADVLTPDGQRLSFRVLGLSYFSAESGQSVMLAEPKAVQGQLVEPDQVVLVEGVGPGECEMSAIISDSPALTPEAFHSLHQRAGRCADQ